VCAPPTRVGAHHIDHDRMIGSEIIIGMAPTCKPRHGEFEIDFSDKPD
jgi:hypothetical protein